MTATVYCVVNVYLTSRRYSGGGCGGRKHGDNILYHLRWSALILQHCMQTHYCISTCIQSVSINQ